MIIDDGSADHIKSLVESWVASGELDINYRWQANQGKTAAVNRGIELARGRFTTIIDDDDRFVENALGRLLQHWQDMPDHEREGFSGVVGLCAFEDGRIVGDRYPADPFDCDPVELAYIHKIAGDKHGLLRTDVLREFLFPLRDLRGHVIDALVWNRMALKYDERHVNEIVTIKEYRPEGITARERELLIRGAPATSQFFLEESQLPHPLPRRTRLRSYANYARYSFHAGAGLRRQAQEVSSKTAWGALVPLGFGLYVRDLWRMAVLSRRTR